MWFIFYFVVFILTFTCVVFWLLQDAERRLACVCGALHLIPVHLSYYLLNHLWQISRENYSSVTDNRWNNTWVSPQTLIHIYEIRKCNHRVR